jgi:hypothetical protein
MSYVSQLGQKLCHFSKDNFWPKKRVFLTALDVCFQKCSGHKAVKFGRKTYLNWDYNLTKNHSILRQSGCDLC